MGSDRTGIFSYILCPPALLYIRMGSKSSSGDRSQTIVRNPKNTPAECTPRLLRIRLKLLKFDFETIHILEKTNEIADTLSRS